MIEQVDPETGTEGLMQVGGVGSGHDTYSHHVTSCLHEHGANTDTGSMGAKSGAAQTAQMATEALQENSKGNLLSWVQNIGNSGKQLLQKIWGDSKESNDAISSQKDGSGNHIAGQETLVTGNSVGVKTTLNRAAVELAALADSISAEIWEISLEIFLVISSAVAEEAAMPEEMVQDRVQTFVPVSASHLMMPSVV